MQLSSPGVALPSAIASRCVNCGLWRGRSRPVAASLQHYGDGHANDCTRLVGRATNFCGDLEQLHKFQRDLERKGNFRRQRRMGTVNAGGTYTAPANLPAPNSVSVTATSVEDTTKNSSAVATVTSDVSVSISPSAASVELGATQPFTATVNSAGNPNRSVSWVLSGSGCAGAGCGTVDSSGTYTAPGIIPAPPSVNLIAISVADSSKIATAAVNLTSNFSLSVSGPTSVNAGASANVYRDAHAGCEFQSKPRDFLECCGNWVQRKFLRDDNAGRLVYGPGDSAASRHCKNNRYAAGGPGKSGVRFRFYSSSYQRCDFAVFNILAARKYASVSSGGDGSCRLHRDVGREWSGRRKSCRRLHSEFANYTGQHDVHGPAISSGGRFRHGPRAQQRRSQFLS